MRWIRASGTNRRLLAADELPVPAARLDFSHFDRRAEKVIY